MSKRSALVLLVAIVVIVAIWITQLTTWWHIPFVVVGVPAAAATVLSAYGLTRDASYWHAVPAFGIPAAVCFTVIALT